MFFLGNVAKLLAIGGLIIAVWYIILFVYKIVAGGQNA